MIGHRLVRLALLPLALLAMGMGPAFCQPPDPLEPNEPPVAKLVWPQIWLVSEPVPFDASGSEDLDGLIDEVTLVFGDGTEAQSSADGRFEHLYVAPGTWDFRLEVRDDHGAPAEILGTVITVERHDDPICDCDLPCLDNAVCTSDGCFLRAAVQGTSSDGELDAGAGIGELPPLDNALSCGG